MGDETLRRLIRERENRLLELEREREAYSWELEALRYLLGRGRLAMAKVPAGDGKADG